MHTFEHPNASLIRMNIDYSELPEKIVSKSSMLVLSIYLEYLPGCIFMLVTGIIFMTTFSGFIKDIKTNSQIDESKLEADIVL